MTLAVHVPSLFRFVLDSICIYPPRSAPSEHGRQFSEPFCTRFRLFDEFRSLRRLKLLRDGGRVESFERFVQLLELVHQTEHLAMERLINRIVFHWFLFSQAGRSILTLGSAEV